MKKYEISTIGSFHTNHNEDSIAIGEIGDDKVLISVMDGCSMGRESHFASTLIAKVLRKVAKEIAYRSFAERTARESSEYLEEALNRLFNELKQLKSQLHLEREEVLSTLIIGLLDTRRKEVEILTIGDGLICCNGRLFEYEQGNKPDYLGYHLDEDFDYWLQGQSQKLSLKDVSDLSISTDGIFTFSKFDAKVYSEIAEKAIIEYLLVDKQWEDNEMMLSKKVLEIEKEYGLKPSDDLTIVRVIL